MRDNLKEAREIFGYTQKQIAEAIGVPPRTYGSWERGERGYTAKELVKLADVYGCSVEFLLSRRTYAMELEAKRAAYVDDMLSSLSDEGQKRLILYCEDLLANPAMRKTQE